LGIKKWFGGRAKDERMAVQPKEISGKFRERPSLIRTSAEAGVTSRSVYLPAEQEARVGLYRFLADAIPALNAAIGTWVAMSVSPCEIEIVQAVSEAVKDQAGEVVGKLFERLYDNHSQRFSSLQALLTEYFGSLYTTGAVAGEVIVTPSRDRLDYFYFVDPASLRFEPAEGNWKIYQERDGARVYFDFPAAYFYGLNADSANPAGCALLRSIPFVARIEQQLLSDMQKSMHNAGYHRIHVKVRPPERMAGESEKGYIERANLYFEKTAAIFKDFRPEDNPITWDDVQIDYIGPSSKISSSSSWYLNHRAILEDLCAGTHLAPFMLGYSHGATQNWAMFKYELVQRKVRAVQRAASDFLEWLCSLELALRGIEAECKIKFRNEEIYGLGEKVSAEQARVQTIINKRTAGLIGEEEARAEISAGRII